MGELKNCWNCGQADMIRIDDGKHPYRKCSVCGATEVDVGKLGAPAFTERVVPGEYGNIERKPYTKGRRKGRSKYD